MIAMIGYYFYHSFSLLYFIIPITLLGGVLFYGSYFINSNFFIKVKCIGNENTRQVSLTFDDGPDENKTATVLDILKKNKVQATFFCIGHKMENQPYLLKRIEEDGHLIGNHSYSHNFFFDLFTLKQMKKELVTTNKVAVEIANRSLKLFRPPYGVTTPVLAKAINECGMQPIGWSLRSLDTVIKDETSLVNKIEQQIKPGDIVLLHDTSSVTVNSLQRIIDSIRKKGLEPVRLDQLIKLNPYA